MVLYIECFDCPDQIRVASRLSRGLRISDSFRHVVSSSNRWLATKAASATVEVWRWSTGSVCTHDPHKNGSVLPLCGQHILGGGRAPLSYLLERDMHRRPFPFLAGEDTPQTTLSHPYSGSGGLCVIHPAAPWRKQMDQDSKGIG